MDAGEVDWHETITTWREILGLDAADHAAADARERAWRAGGARSLRNRVRSRSLVASAHDERERKTGRVERVDGRGPLAQEGSDGLALRRRLEPRVREYEAGEHEKPLFQ